MKKLLSNKKIFILLLAVFSAVCLAIGLFASNVNADSVYHITYDNEIKSYYELGEEFTVPRAVVTNGDKVYSASFTFVFPDGNASQDQKITLNQVGRYSIYYSAFIEEQNKYFTDTLSFNVKLDRCEVDGEGEISYVDDFHTKTGVSVKMFNGDTFYYNDVIDLNDFDVESPLLKFTIIPQLYGEADVDRFDITLTDVYDASKFVTLRLKKCEQTGYIGLVTYIDCTFNNERYVAIEESSNNPTYEYNDKHYRVYENIEMFGVNTMFTWIGGRKTESGDYSPTWFALCYDLEKSEIYAEITYENVSTVSRYLISVLNDSALYPQVFGGFTDGKVKLSVTPYMFEKSYCEILFTEIAGESLNKNNYKSFDYSEGPNIAIDYCGYGSENLPMAKTGTPYSVFSATAFDRIDGYVDVKTNVYFGYNAKNSVFVNVIDGKFTPKFSGYYTIEYVAENSMGNKTVKTVKVIAEEKSQNLDFELSGLVNTADIGSEIKLFDSYTANNVYGKNVLSAEIVLSTNQSVKYIANESNGYAFTPLYGGDYDVIVTCSDYVETATKHFSLTVNTVNSLYYRVDKGYFVHYAIKNGTYEFPKVTAINLAEGYPKEVDTDLFVKFDENAEQPVTGDTLITGDTSVTLYYKPQNIVWAEPYTVTIPVVDTGLKGYIKAEKYFVPVLGSISYSPTSENVGIEGTSLVSNSFGFEFANVLAGDYFSLNFSSYITAQSTCVPVRAFEIVLTDASNSENYVKLLFTVNALSGVLFSVNDGVTTKIAENWNKNTEFILNYNVSEKSVEIAGRKIKAETLYGKEDAPLFDNGIFAKFTVTGVNKGCGVCIATLNDQTITSSKYDRIPPRIDTSLDSNSGDKELNSLITFNKYAAYDVFSPWVKTTISVTDVHGNVMSSLDGTLLNGVEIQSDYQIRLTEYGSYNVTVVSRDMVNGKDSVFSYTINVVDNVLPVITLLEHETTAKVGEEFTIASVKVDKPKCTVFAVIVNPDGAYRMAKGTYTFNYSGKYQVIISAIDESGNLSSVKYTVTVK